MIYKFSITEKKSGMIFLKSELPGQPPKRQTGIEKNGEKPDETFRQKDGERDYILNLVL